ncbi:MAG: hypothetical protein ACRDQB_12520 [Thermocrispum sp.]
MTTTRASEELRVITETLRQPVPDVPPADLIIGRHVPDPSAEAAAEAEHRPWGMATVIVAQSIHTALRLLRSDGTTGDSPVLQAEDAKRRRDIGGEIAALTGAHDALTRAPWYPARRGDLLHIHYPAAGGLPDGGETYLVDASELDEALLSMRLVAHTLTDDAAGFFAVEDSGDPLYGPWFEAGPGRLTVVRDGLVVHAGGGAR